MDFSVNDPTAYVICSTYSIPVFPYFVIASPRKETTLRGFAIIWCLTIRLRALNFCEVIVNEGEAQVNYRFIEIESE